ncbi:MAG TPA: phosphatase PAP2 family protein [Gemmatimonadaceae bacterium]|nr:phosphatase PAP2 family protein [Gemmatimonadaceae bacterium]
MRSSLRLLVPAIAALMVHVSPAWSQADTVTPPRRLFTERDAGLAAAFVVGGYFTRPLDRYFAQRLQTPTAQDHQFLQKTSSIVNSIAVPGAFFIGAGMYGAGRLSKSRKLADLGLHGTEALLIGEALGGVMKGFFGRARPYTDPKNLNPDNWQLMRGFGKEDGYRSFPSGHSVAAFAAAAAVTSEMSRWHPETRWLVGTAMYGGAGMVGLSRMYNNRHWASDVLAGAAIGIFAGNKVVRYHHSHPGNPLDEWLVNFTMVPAGGIQSLQLSILPRPR